MLKRWGATITLVVAAVMVPMGIWGPGLWDPWEMNAAQVARRMAEAPRVLVAEGRDGRLAQRLEADLADGATVEVAAAGASGPSAIEAARTRTGDQVFRVVVVDVDARVQGPEDDAGLRALADLLSVVANQNLSTRIVLVSPAGRDAGVLRDKALARIKPAGDDADDPRPAVEAAVHVATADGVVDAVRDLLGGDGFLAQFKEGGRTRFLAPLHPWLASLAFRAFGFNEFAVRLPGALLGALTLVLVFFGVRRAFDERTAMLAVLVLATCAHFLLGARYAYAAPTVQFGLALGATAFGAAVTGASLAIALPVLALATVLMYLAGGMTAVVILGGLAAAYPLVAGRPDRRVLAASGLVLGLVALAAVLTFLPDGAFFRQFRFTAATFGGGMKDEYRDWAFALKQVGFGMFPWSALLPLALAGVLAAPGRPRPERLVVLLAGLAPLGVLMVTIRPFDQAVFAGVPALAVLVALYLRDREDDPLESRLLAFFAFGLLLLMAKNLLRSPDPFVSYLATDPMFAAPGKGDPAFPEGARLPLAAKLAMLAAAGVLFATGARAFSFLKDLPARLARGRTFLWVLLALAGVIVIDILVFVGLKWAILSGRAGPDAAVGPVLLRIFLTGPDILALYLVVLGVVAVRYADAIGRRVERFVPRERLFAFGRLFLALERPVPATAALAASSVVLAASLAFGLVPELSYHLSQKHILETYRASNARQAGDLFRHGVFAGRGGDDANFYTSRIPDVSSRSQVVDRLKDTSKRAFFIVPKTQWSEINHAFRQANEGRSAPVLDDRSSRFILVSNVLADGETDHNWLADATLTQAQFDAVPGVVKTSVNFEDKLELVGVKLASPAIRRGGTLEMNLYFKVLDKVGTSYRMFLHVDRVGSSSRIHGDHWIRNLVKESEDQTQCVGCYATTHWLKGDIVIDTYGIDVPIGSPSGPHDIWMGFYSPGGDKRLTVKSFDKDKIRHDGSNRVRVGTMTVE